MLEPSLDAFKKNINPNGHIISKRVNSVEELVAMGKPKTKIEFDAMKAEQTGTDLSVENPT